MTHEELLAKIKTPNKFLGVKYAPDWQHVALLAVVELHKPVQGSSDIQTYDYIGCKACQEWSHDGNMNVSYPCPTIQAIEEHLQ